MRNPGSYIFLAIGIVLVALLLPAFLPGATVAEAWLAALSIIVPIMVLPIVVASIIIGFVWHGKDTNGIPIPLWQKIVAAVFSISIVVGALSVLLVTQNARIHACIEREGNYTYTYTHRSLRPYPILRCDR